jgi:hypothetical protein
MRFKKYYKDILSLVAALSLLGTVYFVNHYDIKQLYREFATLSLKVKSQEKQIETLSSRVDLLAKQNQDLLWKDDYLATKKVNVNTIGEINVVPKIKKLDKDEFVSYIDESYLGGITIRGQGEVQKIEPPRNQFSFGPFIGVAYNNVTGLTEPIVGIGVSYNLIKIWDWR